MEEEKTISDEEALERLTAALKDNSPNQDEKHNVHTFLFNVATADDTTRLGFIRDDKERNEMGLPSHTLRGSQTLALISDKILTNDYFKEFFAKESAITTDTSLSREGFLIRQATVSTKQVVDATKRKKINKGWFGKQTEEVQGGDITTQN